jgi:hypothetical protein
MIEVGDGTFKLIDLWCKKVQPLWWIARISGGSDSLIIPILISDVSTDIFHLLHRYMYVHTFFDDITKPWSKEIINAADKYGIVNLKGSFCRNYNLYNAKCDGTTSVCRVQELCFLKRVSVIDFIALDKVEAIEKLSFNDAPGTIAKDILIAISRGDKNEDELTTM